ncbi:MAG: right-handed parallel beta-helix repeat-containing protein [Bacteroidetes bacterium]|nr:right-handed parallel beta-helix repeat-containing protein [Bacteroidota bacterium]
MSFAQPYYVNDASTAGDVYTSAVGNDANPGTAAAPFLTINHAISIASSGDIIYVDVGTYAETVLVTKALTFRGARYGVDARGRVGNESIISSSNASGSIQIGPVAGTVNIDGFQVSGPPAKALQVTGVTTNVIVRSNIFDSATADGINLFRAQNATVEYNWVKGAVTSGITAGDDNGTPSTLDGVLTTATIRYNKIQNSQYGITGYQTGSTISYNEVIGNATVGAGIGGQFYNTVISNNSVHSYTNGAGIAFNPYPPNRADSHDVTATFNRVYDNSAGIYVNQALAGTNISVNSNNITGNTSYGAAMDAGSSGTLDATNNWWGSASGPYQATTNPSGTGDIVSANVTYDPWFGKNVTPELYAVGVSVVPNFVFTGSVTGKNLQISTNTGFTALVLNKTITGSSYTFSSGDLVGALAGGYQLSNNTNYYWRIYDTGTSSLLEPLNPPPPFENYYTFKTVTSAQLNLTMPTNASTVTGGTINFSWYTLAYGVLFDLQYDDDPLFGSPTTIASDLSITYYSFDASSLTPGSTYKWRVIAKTPAGVVTNYSSIWSFTMSGLPTPVPSYPIGNATVYVTSPTLYWYLGTYNTSVTSYNVKYWRNTGSSDPGYPPAVAQSNLQGSFNTGSTDMYATLTASLDAGYTYSWQVQSTNGVQTSAWSTIKTFTVYSSTPTSAPVPYPSWPVGGATSYINPPTLYWYLGTYATGLYFYVEWSSDGFATVAGNSGWFADNLYYALPTALASGTYSWHVKSRIGLAGSESAYSSTATFVIPTSASSSATVPVVTYPTGGATVYVLNPTLGWYAYSTSTLEFQVRISTTSSVDGDGMLSNPLAVSSTSWTTSTSLDVASIPYTLTAGAPYYWQVRSRLVSTPSVVSAWSYVASFATAASSSAVVPLAGTPNFGQPVNNTIAVLNWNLPVKSSSYLNYDVEFSKNSDFSNSTVVRDIPEKVTSLNGLDKNSTYYWRVLSKNSTGSVSNYSQTASFNTGTTTDVKEDQVVPTEFSLLQNYPNPFNPTTIIKFSIPNSQFVTLKVYDMLGREVKTLISQEMNAGTHTINWNADNNLGSKISSGMYVYRITAGNFVSTKKMVLIK